MSCLVINPGMQTSLTLALGALICQPAAYASSITSASSIFHIVIALAERIT